MHSSQNSNDIERQLAGLRSALIADARAAAADARTLADWHYHVRAHPWLACGGALLVGFLLVPRRSGSPVKTELAATFGGPLAQPSQASLAKTVLGLVASYAAKQSVSYLTNVGRTMLEHARERHRQPGVERSNEAGVLHDQSN